MIGFNHLGRLGQLGNQMFQYAALKGIATNRNYSFIVPCYPDPVVDALGNHLRTEIFDAFELRDCSHGTVQTETYIQEPGFEYSEAFMEQCPDDVSLVGFFQTEKYFKNIADEVREDFSFKDEIENPCKEMMQAVDKPIALHIRRGDFLTNNANHNNLTLDYYSTALGKFEDDRNVIIFSDDTEWCKQQELFSGDRFLVSESGNSYVDMCLMSMCSDFIIANSTFSWWGAWLANKGTVIAPEKWFGPNNAHLDTSDLYPEHWNVI